MDLNHRIVALVDGIPVKVECESCGSHHKYRRPMEERATDKRERKTASSPRERSAPAPRTAGARAAAEAVQETAREKEWQSRIAGKMADEFVKYTPKGSFPIRAYHRFVVIVANHSFGVPIPSHAVNHQPSRRRAVSSGSPLIHDSNTSRFSIRGSLHHRCHTKIQRMLFEGPTGSMRPNPIESKAKPLPGPHEAG
jgi:hypothetical protein